MQWLHEEFPLSIRDSVLKDSLLFLIKNCGSNNELIVEAV